MRIPLYQSQDTTELQISERSIRTALNHLKTTQEVTIKTTAKYSIITIEKYDEYQNTTHKESINRHSNDAQSTSNRQQSKNDKKEKNGIIYINSFDGEYKIFKQGST